MDFFKSISTGLDNEYAGLAADGITAGDITGFLPTGSYMFNAMLSGDLFGGVPSNKITVIAGEEATGKTFFLLGIIKHFLDNNEQGMVVFFESESAISKAMLEERGLDTKRIMVVPVATIQEFRHQILKVVDNYEKMDVADRRPMMLSLDSFGMLSTTKEVEDTMEGSETKDMTRAAIAKALFRVLTLKLGKLDLPHESNPVALAEICIQSPCQWLPPPLHTPLKSIISPAATVNALTPPDLKLNDLPLNAEFCLPILSPLVMFDKSTYVLSLYPDLPALNTWA